MFIPHPLVGWKKIFVSPFCSDFKDLRIDNIDNGVSSWNRAVELGVEEQGLHTSECNEGTSSGLSLHWCYPLHSCLYSSGEELQKTRAVELGVEEQGLHTGYPQATLLQRYKPRIAGSWSFLT
uniref:Uncharacterized protein n=1 Tax=Salix viminalis TaxID=40686 RepID=A0A6N2K5Y5_SALVM